MAVKHKYLYLGLALACFLGIILVFVFDGYMGVYDTLVMDNGQYPQTIEADQWEQPERYGYLTSTGVERGGKIQFTYTVENHRFSEYTAIVDVSLSYNQETLADLKTETLSVGSFETGEVKWSLDTAVLVPADYPAEQSDNIEVVIKRGETERIIMVNIYPSQYPTKVIVEPSR